MGVVVASAMLVTSPVRVEAQLSTQPFAAYGNAAAVALNALALGTTQVANTQVANSGWRGQLHRPERHGQQPVRPGRRARRSRGKNAYGRGSGVEIGLLTPTVQAVDVNQLKLAQLAEANAPPPSDAGHQGDPDRPARRCSRRPPPGARPRPTYHPDFCPIGRPLTYGLGYVENLQVLPGAAGGLVGTSATGNSVTQTRTVTYMVPNGDGTYGVVAESQAIVAPVSVAGTGITIDIAGPIGFRVTATGKPGDPRNGVIYTGTPVHHGQPATASRCSSLSLQDLLGSGGVNLPIPPLLTLRLGAPPVGLNGAGAPGRRR